jgi:hypothetical protein
MVSTGQRTPGFSKIGFGCSTGFRIVGCSTGFGFGFGFLKEIEKRS